MENPIIVALDLPEADEAVKLAHQLAPYVGGVKVGKELFTAAGPALVERLRQSGARVFLDLKFHDIPNTVAGAVRSAVQRDVQMLTVHASGGRAMLEASVQAARTEAERLRRRPPLVLAVTVLTHMDAAALREVGIESSPEAQVLRLARLATEAGVPGLVCSPREVRRLRAELGRQLVLVTPGIRPTGGSMGDQRRVMTPAEAIRAGADWLVIGRPITRAPDPVATARAILEEILAARPRPGGTCGCLDGET